MSITRCCEPCIQVRSNAPDEDARSWVEVFRGLGDKLRIAVTLQTPAVPPGEPVAA